MPSSNAARLCLLWALAFVFLFALGLASFFVSALASFFASAFVSFFASGIISFFTLASFLASISLSASGRGLYGMVIPPACLLLYSMKALYMPRPMRSTMLASFSAFSSSGVVMKPNSIRHAGIDVSRSTAKLSWCTPLFMRPAIEHTLRCSSLANSTLCCMLWSCTNSNMMLLSAELGS